MHIIRQTIGFFIRKKWLGFFLVFSLFYGIGISTVYRGAIGPKQRTDLTVYIKAAEMVHIGRANHIYGIETNRHWHYVYSPFLAIALAPVSELPFVVLVITSYFLALACLFGTLFLSPEFAPDRTEASWKIIFAAILCLPVFLNTLTRGQLGLMMLFFQAAILLSYLKNRKVLAGILFALAIVIKTSPLAALFFFFLFRKEWKVLASATLSSLVFWILYPALFIGFRTNWDLLLTWKELMTQGSSIMAYKNYLWGELFTPFAGDNQSLYAVLTRFAWRDETNFIAHPSNWVRWFSTGLGIATMSLLFFKNFHANRNKKTIAPVRLMTEFSLYPVWMLIFSPVTQIHHYTSLYFLFLAALFMIRRTSPCSRLLIAGLATSSIFFLLGLIMEPLAWLGLPMWGALILWLILLFCPESSK